MTDPPGALDQLKPLHTHCIVAALSHMAMNGSRLTVMLLAASLDASPALIGLLAALYGLISAFTAVRTGRWIDRIGPRRPMLVAAFMITLGCVIAGVFQNMIALFVSAALVGTYHSTSQMTTHQSVGRYGKPGDRAANFSVHSLAISFATLLGPLASGLAIDHLGYAGAFYLCAAFGFAPMAVLLLGLRKLPARHAHEKAQATPVSGWALLRDRNLRMAYIAAATNNAIWSVWGFMLPLYGHSIALSATAIGTLSACLSTGSVCIRLTMGPLMRRYSQWALIIASQVMVAVGLFGMPFTQVYAALIALAFLTGLGLGLAGPLATTVMYDASPPDKVGEVIGLRMTMANLAQTLVPLLSGAVGATFGVGPVFWAVSAAMMGGAWMNREKLDKRTHR